jgi:ubiquinone/menaquinone biosynthesis C-methylase UbiE/uncharacterized protein YbaR (Trm112 family)
MTTFLWPSTLEAPETDTSRYIAYVCPLCKGELDVHASEYRCPACDRAYPVEVGIPDFRVFDDPYIEQDDDREKAKLIAAKFDDHDFERLIDFYWSITPHNHPALVKRYVRHALTAVERGRQSIQKIEAMVPYRISGEDKRCLEIGCGTGGFLVASKEQFGHVVGIDIAFRWLVVARKRLQEAGVSCQLVCCCAEALPFREGQFDLIVAGDVLEHTLTQREMIAEQHRALRNDGVFFAATPNRLSLTPEPHVRLWGVGWMPRWLQLKYVLWRKGIPYHHIKLVSRFELKALVRQTPFGECRILLPTFSEGEQEGLSRLERMLVKVYHALKDWPVIHQFLLACGPVLHLFCTRRDESKAT